VIEESTSKRASADALIRQLKSAGYSIDTFSVSSTGNWTVDDADWNYKDVPHLNIVHTQVRAIIGSMDDDHITTINLQKVFGIPLPLTLVNYATSATSQTYFTALGPYILIVFTEYIALGENRTEARTTYNIGAAGFARFAFPLLRRIMKKNYAVLMSEDLPMRDRRGTLRSRGFHFSSDGRPRTFTETTDLLFDNVVVPNRGTSTPIEIDRSVFEQDGAEHFVGSDDDRGVRLVRSGENLLVFPRMCTHEGALLDCAAVKNGRISCPWHARVFKPSVTVRLEPGAHAVFPNGSVRVTQSSVILELPSEAPAPSLAKAHV